MDELKIDTAAMQQYAGRIAIVNQRLNDLSLKMNSLYFQPGVIDQLNLLKADLLTGVNWKLVKSASYLRITAEDFQTVENKIKGIEPADFHEMLVDTSLLQMAGTGPAGYAEELEYLVGEGIIHLNKIINWVESEYESIDNPPGKALMKALIPSGIQDFYNIASGIVQGDVTSDEVLEIVSGTLAEGVLTSGAPVSFAVGTAVVELIRYTMSDDCKQLDEKLNQKVTEQIMELDVFGTAAALAEGVVDQLGGTVVEIGFSTVGAIVDAGVSLGKKVTVLSMPFIGAESAFIMDYGDTPGQRIRQLGKDIHKGIDQATDVVFDGFDTVSSSFTRGCKQICSLLADWF